MWKRGFQVFILISVTALFYSSEAFAQLGPGNPGGDPDVPIDGGLSYLIAGGILYGVHRLRKSRKK
jgi:hypothetical protein